MRPCSVQGCPGSGEELHHWAPKCLFGPDAAELWPKGYLCRIHHQEWHKRTGTMAVWRQLPPSHQYSGDLAGHCPVFITADVWQSWSWDFQVDVAFLVSACPDVGFGVRTCFPLLDMDEWVRLCLTDDNYMAYDCCLRAWDLMAAVLQGKRSVPVSGHRLTMEDVIMELNG